MCNVEAVGVKIHQQDAAARFQYAPDIAQERAGVGKIVEYLESAHNVKRSPWQSARA